MPLDFTNIHEQYLTSNPNSSGCVYQNGRLYTRDGRLIPSELSDTEMQRIEIPAHFKHLLEKEQPSDVEYDFGDLDMDDLEPDEEDQVYEHRHRGIRVQETIPAGSKGNRRR